jgi:hypothetical protein
MTRDEILETAQGLINGDRARDYGDAKATHRSVRRRSK